MRQFPRDPPPRVISYRKGERKLWNKRFPPIYPQSEKKIKDIFPCGPSLSLAEYDFSENTGRKYPFMVGFGWIHVYVETDLVCVCVCLQKGFAAAEQNQDYWVNGQDDCRLLYVSASVTAAAPSGLDDDYRACLRHKGGVIAASFVWSICPLINIVISCFFFLFRCSDSLQLRWTNGVSLCDTHPFGVHT